MSTRVPLVGDARKVMAVLLGLLWDGKQGLPRELYDGTFTRDEFIEGTMELMEHGYVVMVRDGDRYHLEMRMPRP